MLVLGRLFVFEDVETLKLRVASSQRICSFAQVIFQMMIAAVNYVLIFSVKRA